MKKLRKQKNTQHSIKNSIQNKTKNQITMQLLVVSILCLIILILMSNSVSATSLEKKEIKCIFEENNNTYELISFTPMFSWEDILDEQEVENVFRIRRENYSAFLGQRRIMYTINIKLHNQTIIKQNISKLISSFSTSQTGTINSHDELSSFCEYMNNSQTTETNHEGIRIEIEFCNESAYWRNETISICNLSSMGRYNFTINNTFTNNTFTNTLTNTTTITNITNENINENETENINETQDNQTSEMQDLTKKYEVSIFSNQNIFEKGEKTTIQFYVNDTSNFKNVTYWLEDVYGVIKKNPITSTNLNSKSHTWTTVELSQVIVFLKAEFCFFEGCIYAKQQLLGVYNPQYNENENNISAQSNEEETQTNKIIIHECNVEEKHENIFMNLKIEIKKVFGQKQIVTCNIRNDKDIRITPEMTFALRTQATTEQRVSAPLFSLPEYFNIKCEGLDTQTEVTIQNPMYINDKKEITNEENSNQINTKEVIKKESTPILSFYTRATKLNTCILFYSRIEPVGEAELSIIRKKTGRILNNTKINIINRETTEISVCNLTQEEELVLTLKNEEETWIVEENFSFQKDETTENKITGAMSLERKNSSELFTNIDFKNEQEEKTRKFIYIILGIILIGLLGFVTFKYETKRNNSFIKEVILRKRTNQPNIIDDTYETKRNS